MKKMAAACIMILFVFLFVSPSSHAGETSRNDFIWDGAPLFQFALDRDWEHFQKYFISALAKSVEIGKEGQKAVAITIYLKNGKTIVMGASNDIRQMAESAKIIYDMIGDLDNYTEALNGSHFQTGIILLVKAPIVYGLFNKENKQIVINPQSSDNNANILKNFQEFADYWPNNE